MIQTERLDLNIAGRTLVRQLDWAARPGECWSIIGRNGAGKSTLMRTLAGLHRPSGGAVLVRGRALDTWAPDELARERAFLAQSRHD
ncbi:ATP-binding cassette domain-containing protein, partial [Christiangramia marina]